MKDEEAEPRDGDSSPCFRDLCSLSRFVVSPSAFIPFLSSLFSHPFSRPAPNPNSRNAASSLRQFFRTLTHSSR